MNYLKSFFKAVWNVLNFSRKLILNLIFFGILFAILFSLETEQEKVNIEAGSALVLNLNGFLVEQKRYVDPIDAAFADMSKDKEPGEILVDEVVKTIDAATKDQRIALLVLDLKSLRRAHVDKLQSIGEAIVRFKESGKQVIAYGDYYSQSQYYLASYANEVILHPYGGINIDGFGTYPVYFKEALEKLAVTQHVFRVGTYKSAVEPLIRNDMSDAAKEANRLWLNALWQQYKTQVSSNRSFEVDNFDETLSGYIAKLSDVSGDYAQYALKNAWVDSLATRQQLRDKLTELVGPDADNKSFKHVSYDDYVDAIATMPFVNPLTNKVAVVVAKGAIHDGKQRAGEIGGDSTAALLRRARLDDSVKAVVLRIDSGGGSMFASEIIRDEVLALKAAGKPVVASMGSVAASGGYWIAASANEIWASPSTITGSIGVFGAMMTIENSLKKLGIYSDGVGTTEMQGSSFVRGIDPQLSNVIQMGVENAYDKFLTVVGQSRDLSKEAVDKIAQGRVWLAPQALEFGLVDKLGSKQDAIASAASLANLDFYDVITVEEELSPEEQMLQKFFGTAAVKNIAASVGGSFSMESKLNALLGSTSEMLQQQTRLIQQFNDPNGIYSRCFYCEAIE
ncbi:signal peptide peptidase SppA [Pseudoalteromonas fenneropenaei]|uniref:Signal peptide peptidase SppA n=1 Tax=Pseudoalteromonas fenneropenaei TaxID=1737459 RepID=A0ABV7CFE9_9GAMM